MRLAELTVARSPYRIAQSVASDTGSLDWLRHNVLPSVWITTYQKLFFRELECSEGQGTHHGFPDFSQDSEYK